MKSSVGVVPLFYCLHCGVGSRLGLDGGQVIPRVTVTFTGFWQWLK